VPILAHSPSRGAGVNLGVRDTLADLGQTVAENFGTAISHGTSFLNVLRNSKQPATSACGSDPLQS
jgi:phosphopentomutase